jgi:hypothetical protein
VVVLNKVVADVGAERAVDIVTWRRALRSTADARRSSTADFGQGRRCRPDSSSTGLFDDRARGTSIRLWFEGALRARRSTPARDRGIRHRELRLPRAPPVRAPARFQHFLARTMASRAWCAPRGSSGWRRGQPGWVTLSGRRIAIGHAPRGMGRWWAWRCRRTSWPHDNRVARQFARPHNWHADLGRPPAGARLHRPRHGGAPGSAPPSTSCLVDAAGYTPEAWQNLADPFPEWGEHARMLESA